MGLAEQRRATVVHRPGSGVHTRGTVPLTLEYFALRGLGELPRLILEASGLPYDCVFHYLEGDWKPRAAFGQLPVLHDGELTISQSRAIVRYLARKACIDGATEAEKARVDSQSVSHYHTPSRELTAYTHTLLWSSFKCAAGISVSCNV